MHAATNFSELINGELVKKKKVIFITESLFPDFSSNI